MSRENRLICGKVTVTDACAMATESLAMHLKRLGTAWGPGGLGCVTFLPGARKPFALTAQRFGAAFPRDREHVQARPPDTQAFGFHGAATGLPSLPGTVSAPAPFAMLRKPEGGQAPREVTS